jgi:hypothetical protein
MVCLPPVYNHLPNTTGLSLCAEVSLKGASGQHMNTDQKFGEADVLSDADVMIAHI